MRALLAAAVCAAALVGGCTEREVVDGDVVDTSARYRDQPRVVPEDLGTYDGFTDVTSPGDPPEAGRSD